MITYTLYYGVNTGITNTESLTCFSTDERLTRCGSVKSNITNDDIFLRFIIGGLRRIDDEPCSTQSFSTVIVGITLQFKSNPLCVKRSETLPRRTCKFEMYGIFRQTGSSKLFRNLVGENSSCGSICIFYCELPINSTSALYC